MIAGASMEITLSQFWSSLGDSQLHVEVAFHGVEVRVVAAAAAQDGLAGNMKLIVRRAKQLSLCTCVRRGAGGCTCMLAFNSSATQLLHSLKAG